MCQFKRSFLRKAAVDNVFFNIANHRRGITGAALVEQQDVAMLSNALKGVMPAGVKGDRGLARPTGNGHKRVAGRLQAERRDDRDFEINGAKALVVRVQGPDKGAAACSDPGRARAGANAAIRKLPGLACGSVWAVPGCAEQ